MDTRPATRDFLCDHGAHGAARGTSFCRCEFIRRMSAATRRLPLWKRGTKGDFVERRRSAASLPVIARSQAAGLTTRQSQTTFKPRIHRGAAFHRLPDFGLGTPDSGLDHHGRPKAKSREARDAHLTGGPLMGDPRIWWAAQKTISPRLFSSVLGGVQGTDPFPSSLSGPTL